MKGARVHPDYVRWLMPNGTKMYSPKLIGEKLSIFTFPTATDAKALRARVLDRYWRFVQLGKDKGKEVTISSTATISPDSGKLGVSSEIK